MQKDVIRMEVTFIPRSYRCSPENREVLIYGKFNESYETVQAAYWKINTDGELLWYSPGSEERGPSGECKSIARDNQVTHWAIYPNPIDQLTRDMLAETATVISVKSDDDEPTIITKSDIDNMLNKRPMSR